MKENKLFVEFVEFCKAQDPEKEIDHSNWKSCAVGEFAASKGVVFPEGYLCGDTESEIHARSFIENLSGLEYNELKELYEEDSLWFVLNDKWVSPRTYGKLVEFLSKF